ncbi:Ral GTPase-activating protein subunit beta [Dirofilaria immitis]
MGLYAEWPLIEFFPLNNSQSSLSVFSKKTGDSVAELLLHEIGENLNGQMCLKIDTEEQLSWILQVVSYALTLSHSTSKEHEALCVAVHAYCAWLNALLKDTVQTHLPGPMKRDPGNYICILLDSLRALFVRKNIGSETPVIATQQAYEIENVLRTVVQSLLNCDGKHKDITWPAVLKFLLNATDLLLSGQTCLDDVTSIMAPNVTKTLLDVFLCAARLEQIPSPVYWKTLSFLSKRWRHQVSFIENWARKVVSLTVIIVQEMYGESYCPITITDEQVKLFVSNSKKTSGNDDTLPMLHVCWFQLMHMIGNPASIISFEPRSTSALPLNVLSAMIATGGAMDSDGNPLVGKFDEELTEFTISSLRRCFFMTSAAVMKLVDVFYGDSRVSIDFRESDELMQHWSDLNYSASEDWLRHQQVLSRGSNNSAGMIGDNATLTAAHSPMKMSGGNSVGTKNILNVPSLSKSRSTSERSWLTSIPVSSPAVSFVEEMSLKIPKPNSAQFVWHYLQNNKIHKPYLGERQPKVAQMLDTFMDWLAQSSLAKCLRSSGSDAYSHRSMSSVSTKEMSSYLDERMTTKSGTENTEGNASGVVAPANESAISRQSFGLSHSAEWPEVDGVSAGRATALGTLCRIICSKKSKETITDSQLAQFYKVVYETLLEKDRLMLCALIYFGGDVFRLALKSVEILLPQFVQALEMIYKESMKLRLHPSIDEVQMRRACLKALSSIISWPTTFGNMLISDLSSSHSNTDENLFTYIEILPQMHHILITALLNEVDPINLFLILTMCTIVCEESCLYNLNITNEKNAEQEKSGRKNFPKNWKEECCVSIVRSIASAVCQNLCKPQWSSELSVCLSALDCLDALSNMSQTVLFNEDDMSVGFLIVTSLCRFIDTQLMKPPPLHSKDLHSSVVAAYFSLSVWLCAAPLLLETESCLTTVAETIELGLTGGKNLPPLERKAASKRVNDAAENLLYMIFSALGHIKQDDIIDEKKLLYKFGSQVIDITKFKYLLIQQQTLLSIHEATKLSIISKGFPSVFLVLRSPYHVAYTLFVQLQSWAAAGTSAITGDKESVHFENGAKTSDPKNIVKFFHIPFEFGKSYCKLDSVIPPLQPTSDTDRVIAELTDIRKRMSQGESCLRSSDDRNVWLREPLAKELSKLAQPTEPPTNCNAGRVLLYDLGLISEESYKSGDIVLLDSSNLNFYHDLHQIVDRSPTKLLQTVRLFYVRDGQRSAVDILANAMNLQNTNNLFCGLLAELGEGVEVKTHPHWTGDWTTAFSAERKPKEAGENLDNYIIDGFTHCLWWTNSHIEIAFTTPTERIRKQQECGANCNLLAKSTSVSGGQIDLDNAAKTSQHDFDSQAFSDERSAGQISGNSSGRSNKLLESFLSAHSKSHSGVDSDGEIKENGSERITFVKRNSDQRVYVVFLERIEDMHYFPYEEMFPMTTGDSLCSGLDNARPDLIVIFISEVENKLVRINIIGDWTKCGLPGPLIDDCLVSSSALPNLLKYTIVSIARRKTIELENYQLVASKRRHAIQEFARKYAIKKSYSEFIELLLNE